MRARQLGPTGTAVQGGHHDYSVLEGLAILPAKPPAAPIGVAREVDSSWEGKAGMGEETHD